MGNGVFVSYSHEDGRVVKPVVALYRATRESIFIDGTDIPLGAKWRSEIFRAIDACSMVWVFWCRHSADSHEVEIEYLRGIEQGKPTVPVLLDPTPVAQPLAAFQWLDMQGAFAAHEEERVETMSLEEAHRIQRADRTGRDRHLPDEQEDREDPSSGRVYRSDGNLFREGWELAGDRLIRRNRVVREPSRSELQTAVAKLIAHLEVSP